MLDKNTQTGSDEDIERPALGLGKEQTEESLTRMLSEHAGEWKEFVRSMGSNSFIRQWVRAGL